MAKIRVYSERGLVTFSGKLNEGEKFELEQYTAQGFTVRMSKPAKKRTGTKEKDAWKAVMTPEDAAKFEELCAAPKKGGLGFFGARQWAKDQGYSIDKKEEEAKPAKKRTTRTTTTKKTAPKAAETAKAEETTTEEAK